MGMDYRYLGSASYPRFDRELCEIAKILGGVETEHLKERRETENERPLGYWFGFYSSDSSGEENEFTFPDGTNETIVKWFNNVYGDFTPYETMVIWKKVKEYPEIEEISSQIYNELRLLCEYGEGWKIR